MFENIDIFLQGKSHLTVDKYGRPTTRDLHIATAVLLVEMANIDDSFVLGEMNALMATLQDQFEITDRHAAELIEIAEFMRKDRSKIREFLVVINGRFEDSQKETVLAMLWKVMKADGHVSQIEATLAAKIAKALNLGREHVERARKMLEEGSV